MAKITEFWEQWTVLSESSLVRVQSQKSKRKFTFGKNEIKNSLETPNIISDLGGKKNNKLTWR